MDWNIIIPSIVSLVGVVFGAYKMYSLIDYKMEQAHEKIDKIEKKLDIHNGVQDRVLIIEQKVERIEKVLDAINDRTSRHGEQIDNAFTLAEKNESKISLIEKILAKGEKL